MTDEELRAVFGLSGRALNRLRATGKFPAKDPLVGKTDRRAVDAFFDRRAGLSSGPSGPDGEETGATKSAINSVLPRKGSA
ncbi:MAG TPA: hypothetical protein VGN97_10205 [Mesorhizobium sp.]|jgi:hypothetical protein|nr:hypothetical protein [Mesorhizobium sp.]